MSISGVKKLSLCLPPNLLLSTLTPGNYLPLLLGAEHRNERDKEIYVVFINQS